MRRYCIAAAIGGLFGLLVLFMLSAAGWRWPGFGMQYIPCWGTNLSYSPEIRNLARTAVLLRAAKLLIEHGFWFWFAPAVFACGLVRLSEKRRQSHVCYAFYASMVGAVILLCTTFIASAAIALTHQPLPPGIDNVIFRCIDYGLSVTLLMCVFGALPCIWFGLFCISLENRKQRRLGIGDGTLVC